MRKTNLSLFVIVAVLATVSLWSTTDLLRKNDQASILAGALAWAGGEPGDWRQHYQFDKTYVLYAYNAFWLALADALDWSVDPVLLTNRVTAAAFWLALVVFVARYRRTLDPLLLVAGLTTPAILFNTQYLNSSTLSSAFLLLSVAAYRPGRAVWPAALLVFLAVGARADVVLLLPLYGWLVWQLPTIGKPVSESFQRLEKVAVTLPTIGNRQKNRSNDWKSALVLGAAGAAALVVGRVWAGGAGVTVDLFFEPRMVAGYLAFGFGAAGLAYGWVALRGLAGLPLAGWARGLALAAFLVPLLFFLPQLHAPRYFWRAVEALWLVQAFSPVFLVRGRWVRGLVWLVAAVPLLVGVRLPALTQPQLVVCEATRFPSGDGHYPMGAYGDFLGQLRRGMVEPVDHNQRVWRAVRAAELEVDGAGTVPVLFSPMYGYFRLAGVLRGQAVTFDDAAGWGATPFYVDSRTLARADVKFRLRGGADLLERPMRVVSPELDGIAVVQVGAGDLVWSMQTRLLRGWFGGNEYRIGAAGTAVPAGHRAVWFAAEPFAGAEQDAATGWWTSTNPAPVRVAWTALPGWMSVQSFGR
jgi:hypothetical protein